MQVRAEARRPTQAHPVTCSNSLGGSQVMPPDTQSLGATGTGGHRHRRAARTGSRSHTLVNVWADVSPLSTGRTRGPWRRREKGKAPHLEFALATDQGHV